MEIQNRFRKKREGVEKSLEMERWNKHFMEMLEGMKNRVVLEEEGDSRREGGKKEERREEKEEEEEEEEEEITKEEVIKQLKKLKKGKAPGENVLNGIENETWRLMLEEIGETFMRLINKKEGEIPEEGNRGLIYPIYKRGDKENVMNYRDITLMDTVYKIYASILNKRMKQKVQDKLRERQFRFREGKGTIDAIYVMNHVVNKGIAKKKRKIFAFFADLKAAFDKVDRDKLREMLKKAKIKEKLRKE